MCPQLGAQVGVQEGQHPGRVSICPCSRASLFFRLTAPKIPEGEKVDFDVSLWDPDQHGLHPPTPSLQAPDL